MGSKKLILLKCVYFGYHITRDSTRWVYEGIRHLYKILIEKHEGKRLTGQQGSKYEVYSKVAVEETGSENLDWISLAQDSFQGSVLVNRAM